MDVPSFRYFVLFVLGAVLIICAGSELVRWWTSEDEDDELPEY